MKRIFCLVFSMAMQALVDDVAEKSTVPSRTTRFELDALATADADVDNPDSIIVPLTVEKPKGVIVEPLYRSRPRYAVVKLGDGPRSDYFLAVDEPENGEFRLYVDQNRNGNLSDDGDGGYDTVRKDVWTIYDEDPAKTAIRKKFLMMRASRGPATGESSTGKTGVIFERVVSQREIGPKELNDFLRMSGTAAGVGMVTIAGKSHKAILIIETVGSIYPKPMRPLQSPTRPQSDFLKKAPPFAWLRLDLNDNGLFDRTRNRSGAFDESFDVFRPFEVAGVSYEATWAADASSLVLRQTIQIAENHLLPPGVVAPDFAVEGWDGGQVKLSDFKGQVVVLDFWYVGCGPCMRSFPHLDRIARDDRKQGVIVLAVCTNSPEPEYQAWLKKVGITYKIKFAFDPAQRKGREESPGITGAYRVSAYPSTFVIDRDGKIAASSIGFDEKDKRLDRELEKLGITPPSGDLP